jgi:hypothetical protein
MSNELAITKEPPMSTFAKLALILAIAAIAIAAKQLTLPGEGKSAKALSLAPALSISPEELTHSAPPMPETKVDSYF